MSDARQEKTVRDLLIPLTDYPHMPYWASLKEAMVQLTLAQGGLSAGERRRTVLVFDEAYKLQGILTQRDILRGIEPRFAQAQGKSADILWEDVLTAGARERSRKPIGDFMSPAGRSVEAGEGLLQASHAMLQEGLDLLPVVEGRKVLGVVRLDDLFQEIGMAVVSA